MSVRANVGADAGAAVRIRYHRPPGREQVFEQTVVHRTGGAIVTLLEHTRLERPLVAGDDEVMLEDASPAVWFTFPGEWHDIGRFHRADGTFTGYYANVLTPVVFHDAAAWETTDLFLDVWLPNAGNAILLDEDEFDDAVKRGWLDADTAGRAREEADRIMGAAAGGRWPPGIVREWTLERARKVRTRA